MWWLFHWHGVMGTAVRGLQGPAGQPPHVSLGARAQSESLSLSLSPERVFHIMQLISLMLPPALPKGSSLSRQIRTEFHKVQAQGATCRRDDGRVVGDGISLQLMRLCLPAHANGLMLSIRAVGRAWLGGSTCTWGKSSVLRTPVSYLC